MKPDEIDQQLYISHVEPVLAVRDVLKTVAYWHETLGFPGNWTWGQPVNHGGVSWHGAFIQFDENPQLAAVSEGHCIAVFVKQIDKLYAFHQEQKVNIVSPLENKPWGLCEYMVREINGYYISFTAPVSDRVPGSKKLPETIQLISGAPSPSDYRKIMSAVGWSATANEIMLDSQLSSVVFAVSAKNMITNNVIGHAFLLGDNNGFYYIKDVVVLPEWQGKGIGTALMWELTRWLESNAPDLQPSVCLQAITWPRFTGNLVLRRPVACTDRLFGMIKPIKPNHTSQSRIPFYLSHFTLNLYPA